jgi:hypothetical protein
MQSFRYMPCGCIECAVCKEQPPWSLAQCRQRSKSPEAYYPAVAPWVESHHHRDGALVVATIGRGLVWLGERLKDWAYKTLS